MVKGMADEATHKKEVLNVTQLSEYDDVLTDALVDRVSRADLPASKFLDPFHTWSDPRNLTV